MTTAIIKDRNGSGNLVIARALLDSYSTVNLITQKFTEQLNSPARSCSMRIGAVDVMSTVSTSQVQVTFQSSYNSFQLTLTFLVVPSIAALVPNDTFPRYRFDVTKYLQLADPQFHLPKPVDLLLVSNTLLLLLILLIIINQAASSRLRARSSENPSGLDRCRWFKLLSVETGIVSYSEIRQAIRAFLAHRRFR